MSDIFDDEQEAPKLDPVRVQELDDLRVLLAQPAGQRFFKKFFNTGKILKVNMSGNSWSFFWEGHRNCALTVWHDIVEADEVLAAKLLTDIFLEGKGDLKNG